MTRCIYRYIFPKHVPMDDVEESLMLAALAAESLHGRAAMKLDACFSLSKKNRTCVIDAETQIGCDIAKMLAGFLIKGYGDRAFSVEQTEGRITDKIRL